MTIRIQLSGTDMARVRFGLSAVSETVRALRIIDRPGDAAIHLPWRRWARPRLPDDPDILLLRRLATSGSAVPLALLPTPDARLPDVRDELRHVRQASPARTIESLEQIFGRPSWLDDFYADPPALLGRVAGAIDRCYSAIIAPHWPRMRALLEADIDFRARRLAAAGIERVIRELHPDIQYSDGEVHLWPNRSNRPGGVVETTGAGLVLCPLVFAWPTPVAALRPTGPACIRYPARGVGTLWELPIDRPESALCDLLGTTRAGILSALVHPADTPTLARRIGVTPGAVSQHLRVLRDAGLVRTARDGRTALHLRTRRADMLIGQDGPVGDADEE
jgi:DNA-binding transcriptional ArsR family regulator